MTTVHSIYTLRLSDTSHQDTTQLPESSSGEGLLSQGNKANDQMSILSPMDRAIEYTRKNWTSGLKIKEISAKFHVDPGNLDRAFRKRYGITIKKFVDSKRKRMVHDLVKRRGIPGYRIGEKLGMSEQTFYRWVKRVMGRSLRDLRNGR